VHRHELKHESALGRSHAERDRHAVAEEAVARAEAHVRADGSMYFAIGKRVGKLLGVALEIHRPQSPAAERFDFPNWHSLVNMALGKLVGVQAAAHDNAVAVAAQVDAWGPWTKYPPPLHRQRAWAVRFAPQAEAKIPQEKQKGVAKGEQYEW